MTILVRNAKTEWEGMAYVAIHGDVNKFQRAGIGQMKEMGLMMEEPNPYEIFIKRRA